MVNGSFYLAMLVFSADAKCFEKSSRRFAVPEIDIGQKSFRTEKRQIH